ncbi:MAG TPA: CGNR zinc finger domain-containing protein [Ilumatobacteraceae bacterium]|nr:CGNR zinc finger domain-containing protein [Ilumatobacteraceae bacterium]
MYVTSGHDTEIRLTLEAMVDLVNALTDAQRGDTADVRDLLHAHGFTRARGASAASIRRVESQLTHMLGTLMALATADRAPTATWINGELAERHITPSLTAHDGAGLHIHWTPTSAAFDEQVVADILMALAQEICDHGTDRFGTCAAVDCDRLFYDATRNGSRRFCSNPRCASRTHTADHRARQRST